MPQEGADFFFLLTGTLFYKFNKQDSVLDLLFSISELEATVCPKISIMRGLRSATCLRGSSLQSLVLTLNFWWKVKLSVFFSSKVLETFQIHYVWLPTAVCPLSTFKDCHVDVGADFWHMTEPPSEWLGSTALCWFQVITAALAGGRWSARGRHQVHQGGEGQNEKDTQHGCAWRVIRDDDDDNDQMIGKAFKSQLCVWTHLDPGAFYLTA